MCLSTFLAFVVGAYLVLTNAAMLLNKPYYKRFTADLGSHPVLYVAGCLSLIFGLLIVTSHNVWNPEWPVLITIFGWFLIIQGVGRLCFPEQWVGYHKQYQNKSGYWLLVWIAMLIGVYLIWEAFAQINQTMPQ